MMHYHLHPLHGDCRLSPAIPSLSLDLQARPCCPQQASRTLGNQSQWVTRSQLADIPDEQPQRAACPSPKYLCAKTLIRYGCRSADESSGADAFCYRLGRVPKLGNGVQTGLDWR